MSQGESWESRTLPGYPKGSPGTIHDAAASLRQLAGSIDNIFDRLGSQAATIGSSWQGSDQIAFSDEWQNFRGATTDFTGQVSGVADKLDQLADQISQAQAKYNQAALEIGVTVAIGVAATILTWGAGAAPTAEAVSAEVGAAAVAVEETASIVTIALDTALSMMRTIITRLVINFAASVGLESITGAIAFPDHSFNHVDFMAALESAGAMTVLGGVGGRLGAFGAGRSALSAFVIRTGGVGLSAAGLDAITQELTTGHINPMEMLFAGSTAGGAEALMGGIGAFRGRSGIGGESSALKEGSLTLEPSELKTVELDSGTVHNWSQELNHLEPNTRYVVDSHLTYTTDGLGRVTSLKANLSGEVVAKLRNKYRQLQAGGDDRLPNDHGSHILASSLGGPGEAINLIALDGSINKSAYSKMESAFSQALARGESVDMQWDINYDSVSMRPEIITVTGTIGGKPVSFRFVNTPTSNVTGGGNG